VKFYLQDFFRLILIAGRGTPREAQKVVWGMGGWGQWGKGAAGGRGQQQVRGEVIDK